MKLAQAFISGDSAPHAQGASGPLVPAETAVATDGPTSAADALLTAASPVTEPAWQQVLDWLVLGGPIVWVLMALATVAMAIVLVKLWQFARAGVGRDDRAFAALASWNGSNHDDVIRSLSATRDPVSHVLRIALAGLRDGFDGELVREEVERVANETLEALRHFLRPLAFIGTTSPLLGLLGTVIGMIAAFQGIQNSGTQVDPTVLSGGIWEALLTTAVGLSVAIPVTLAHAYLERRIERLGHRIESASSLVFTGGLSNVVESPRVGRHRTAVEPPLRFPGAKGERGASPA